MSLWNTTGSLLLSCFMAIICGAQSAEQVRVDIARDTWLSNYPAEVHGSNGAAAKLKLKSIQELSILDFQASPLRGKKIVRARLFLKSAGDETIERVTLSTITCDWIEGTGSNYQVVEGASSFSHRRYPYERWNHSDLTAVCIGQGGSLYASVDAKPAELPGWYQLEVPPRILEARLAGLSFGIVLMDDTGSTWKRDGDKITRKHFPNRYLASRDSNRASAPYLLVDVESAPAEDAATPPPQDLQVLEPTDQDPRTRLTWTIDPAQRADRIGFTAEIDGTPVPQYHIPSIEQHRDGRYVMPLAFVPELLGHHQPYRIHLRALSRSGRASRSAELECSVPKSDLSELPLRTFPHTQAATAPKILWEKALSAHGRRWSIIDPLDTLLPASNTLIPQQRDSYLASNHLWNANAKTISLDSPRGGWVGFQVICDTPPESIEMHLELGIDRDAKNAPPPPIDSPKIESRPANAQEIRTEWYRYATVPNKDTATPDPLVLLARGNAKLQSSWKPSPTHQSTSWLIECYVPPETKPGKMPGRLLWIADGKPIELAINLNVHDVVLPKTLSFLPEMNCYGLPEMDREYYRLGHRHRTVLNRVPYSQSGVVAKHVSPLWRDGQLDWQDFDRRYGELFTGAAFADLPRGEIPIECFYFAMHENWPTTMESSYNGNYWADQAFPDAYREAWVSAVAQSAEHVHDQGWKETRFHVFLNNKIDFKSRGWSAGSSPWLLDEPANFQDFIALRYFGLAAREGMLRAGVESKRPAPNVLFRGDISRPQWQRDTLDDLMGYNVVSQSSFREYRTLVLDRKFRENQTVVIYGGNNPIGTNNAMAVAWSWDAWCLGADGVLPWQTIGRKESWKAADELALFYPHPEQDAEPPAPSIRLKAYCYGQQDVEVLALVAKRFAQDRYTFGERARRTLDWKMDLHIEGDAVEPAPRVDYGSLTPEMLHHWRIQWLELAASPSPVNQTPLAP